MQKNDINKHYNVFHKDIQTCALSFSFLDSNANHFTSLNSENHTKYCFIWMLPTKVKVRSGTQVKGICTSLK